eukprot:4795703-Pyramimonas_sp.AAC.1
MPRFARRTIQGCAMYSEDAVLVVDAVQIALDLFLVNLDPFHDHPHSSSVLVANARGFDLDEPTNPRHLDGPIKRPPSGGLGCPACAVNVIVHSPS